MKIRIIFDSKFGNNKQIADLIGTHFEDGNQLEIGHAKDLSPESVVKSNPDLVIFGGPTRIGQISGVIKKWIKKFDNLQTKNKSNLKKVAAFATHLPDTNVIPKWNEFLKTLHISNLIYPEVLDIKVMDLKGPRENDAQNKIEAFVEKLKSFINE
jgi:menaquinone-dependent protoporphyrinogen IX oxidase